MTQKIIPKVRKNFGKNYFNKKLNFQKIPYVNYVKNSFYFTLPFVEYKGNNNCRTVYFLNNECVCVELIYENNFNVCLFVINASVCVCT
jgi:hypothetical protein